MGTRLRMNPEALVTAGKRRQESQRRLAFCASRLPAAGRLWSVAWPTGSGR